MNKISTFLYEVKVELSKTTWPSKDELVGATIIVCVLVIIFSIILGSMDFVFNYLIKQAIG